MMNPDGTFQQDIQCVVPEQNGRGAIFISNLQAACNPNTLEKNNIGAVITAIKGKNLSQTIPKHVQYLYIPVVDHESNDISVFFQESFDFIEVQRKRANVLVHCMAGVSRSVTLVIAYIMQKSNISYETAYSYVKSKRRIIHPNQSFIKQLIELQKRLQARNNQKILSQAQNRTETSQKCNQQVKFNDKSLMSTHYSSTQNFYPNKDYPQTFQKTMAQSEWQNKGKIHRQFSQKQNDSKARNSYDMLLRQNIKKLFSMNSSQYKFFDKSQLIR